MTYYIKTRFAGGDEEINDTAYDTLHEAAVYTVNEGDSHGILAGDWWVIQCFKVVGGVEVNCIKEFKAACFDEWEGERYDPPQIILDLVEEEYTKESGEWDLIDGDPCIAHDNRLTFGDVM